MNSKKDPFLDALHPAYGILNSQNEVVFCGIEEWCAWISNNYSDRVVARDTIYDHLVSTVFLGVNHGVKGAEWFETMVFNDLLNSNSAPHSQRYATYAEAMEGHRWMCRKIQKENAEITLI